MHKLKIVSFFAALNISVLVAGPLKSIDILHVGTYASGVFEEGAAEIVAHDPSTQRLFVVNASAASVDVLDISDPSSPNKVATISLGPIGGVANSVAVRDGIVAIALESFNKTDPGFVVLYDTGLNFLNMVNVGSLPDMITFSPNGRWLLTANEGEPTSYGEPDSVDPAGSISIVDLSGGAATLTQDDVRTVDFSGFESVPAGVRVFGPGASIAQDLEPEYIAVSHDSKTAWVTLQENNALAQIDIPSASVTRLIPLGLKDHSLEGNGLDASDRDSGINIQTWPVLGLYMPDAIAAYESKGKTYLVVANEGDAREYTGFEEEIRIGNEDYVLDPGAFPDGASLKENANLGRLRASLGSGDLDGDGDFDQIHTFGARSFSIRAADGSLVYDSGDEFEQITALLYPTRFNASHDNNTLDARSPAKGPEPEGLTVGRAYGRVYAFVGLERIGGVMAYDITDPTDVRFATYANNRNFADDFSFETAGDLGPEGLLFIKAEHSRLEFRCL